MRTRAAGQRLWATVLGGLLCACAVALAEPPEDAERVVERLNEQASQFLNAGRYAQMLPLAKRALALSEKELGPRHLLTARSLNSLANFHFRTGSYGKAEPLYRRVLTIREQALPAEHPQVASALSNLAVLLGTLGDFARAEPLQQRALAIREKVFGTEHAETAKSLNNLAILYVDTGAYTRAEPLYQRTLAICEQSFGTNHPETALVLTNLAALYYYTGAHAQAEAANLRALAIYEKVLDPQPPEIAGLLGNLGEVYVAMGTHERAMAMYERALAISEKAHGLDHPEVAGALNNIAGLHRIRGEVEQARRLYQRALAITEKRLGPQHQDTARSLNNLANLYFDIGAYAEAAPLYVRALAIRGKIFGMRHPDVVQSLNNLAMLEWASGDMPRALSLLQQAQATQLKISEQILFSGSESRQRAYLRTLAEYTFDRVSFSMVMTDRVAIELGFNSVLQYKGRVLDTVSDNVARLRYSMSSADRLLMDRLARIAHQASTVLYQGQPSPGKRNQRLSELSRQQDALEAQLAKRSSEFRQQTQPVTIASIRQAIPDDAVLVEWVRYTPYDPNAKSVKTQWGPPRYAAYVLTRRGAPVVIDMGDAAALDRLATNFTLAVSNARRADVRQHAAALSDRLIKPLLPQLRGHSRWLLSPDGALNLVPMAALLDAQGRYLVENFEITYLSSGRDLLRNAAATPSTSTQVVLVADPDYGAGPETTLAATSRSASGSAEPDGAGLIFKPLPGSAQEAHAIRELLAPRAAEVLTRLDASEAQLRRLRGPRLLHIATHGFFLNDAAATPPQPHAPLPTSLPNPLLRAGLALAGANVRRSGANDDGILTALEMAQLDLRGTALVVLSACETATGEAASGEGIYGMRRALVLAGAESQITSLWQVSDHATRTLMVDFYRRLLQGDGRSAALREAQRSLLADPMRSHPYYWAGYVPAGNWRAVAQQR